MTARLSIGLEVSILVFFSLGSVLLLNINPVKADVGAPVDLCPPLPLPCFPNTWAPYGPMVQNLRFQYYSGDPYSEFRAFEAGQLDLTDWPTDPSQWTAYDANPDFLQTPSQGDIGVYGIYFNGASSRFTASQESPTSPANGPYWGCDWNTGISFSPSRQTYVTNCGVNMRQAFMHLIDRVRFANNRHLAPLACDSPLAKETSCVPVSQQCAWDTMFPSCVDAYRIAPSGGDGQQPIGSPDFCAAADHMIAAGVASGKDPSTCVLTGVNPSVFAHPMRTIVRSTEPRRTLGNEFITALNQLFGGQAVQPCFGQFCSRLVFTGPPLGPIDDWDMYTYGYRLAGPSADYLASLFNGSEASDYCGGVQNGVPNNNQFVCNPAINTDTTALNNTIDPSTYKTDTQNTFNDLGKYAVDMPVFGFIVRTVALHSVAAGSTGPGLVNSLGVGYPNFYTILNAHQDPSYTPANPIYNFGGGDPTTLRYGQIFTPYELNIFNAQTPGEFNVLNEVYDTLFNNSPLQPSNIFCWMCTSYAQSVDSSGNEHFLVELRQNLRWQDGVPVDAYDVKFSFLNFRDTPTSTAGGNLFALSNIRVLDKNHLDIVWSGKNISYPVFMEEFVIPRHLWELPGDQTYGDVGRVDPAKLNPSYDPLSVGTLIGSGPFMCRSLFPEDLGRLGTGCAKNADGSRATQTIDMNGSLTLVAYDRTRETENTDPFLQYMRSYNTAWGTGTGTSAFSGQFQEFRWADQNKDAQVTISDLAGVASCFGASGPTSSCSSTAYNYWLRSAFHPNSPTTISSEVAIVASHLDDTYVYPYQWNPTNLHQIIPYG